MKKFIIIVAAVAVAVLLYLTGAWIVKDTQIAKLANEIGETYGVTDFKSKSANFGGEAWVVELHSKDFADLSAEDQFGLMNTISTSHEMQLMLVDHIRELDNPLTFARFTVYSNGRHLISLEKESNLVFLKCGTKYLYSAEGIEEHGYKLTFSGSSFTNKFGTANTVCVVDGCSSKIATSGDTNCCPKHSNKCGNCGCYTDGDAIFCMSCLEEALS